MSRAILAGACALLASTSALAHQGPPVPPAPPSLEGVRFEQRLGAKLPLDGVWADESGTRRALGGFFGHAPVVLAFSYYQCPNLCTLVLNGLADALAALPGRMGRDYQVLSVSIDPSERPQLARAKKRAYLARLGHTETSAEAPGWRFLTGDEASIRALTQAAGFGYRWDPVAREFAHPSGLVVVDAHGRISQYLFGIRFEPASLSQALTRAKNGQPGSWVDAVLLYCFHYDPKLSPHGPLILNAIRAVGALGAVCLLLLIAWLARSGRRAAPESWEGTRA